MNLLDLPDDCLLHILSLTSPRDLVQSSGVSKRYLSASESELVWKKFLPSDCDHFISQSSQPLDQQILASKKNLYKHLCRSYILINNGTQSFGLDKRNGKKCFMLGSRMLMLGVKEDRDIPPYWVYWKGEYHKSRFRNEYAVLQTAYRLEIKGRIHTKYLSPNTTYGVYFVFQEHHIDYAIGFKYDPVETSVYEVDEQGSPLMNDDDDQHAFFDYYLQELDLYDEPVAMPEELPVKRSDGWLEVEMGLYHVDDQAYHEKVVLEMVLREVETLNYKCGLAVYGIELRPLR